MKTNGKHIAMRGRRLVIAVALGAGIIAAIGAGIAEAGPAAPKPGLTGEKAQRREAEQDAVAKNNLLDKQAAANAHANQQAQAQALAAPDAGLTAGIVEQRQGPFSAAEFAVGNMYRAKVGDRWLFVFAGATKSPDGTIGESAVRVYQLTAGGSYSRVGQYASPVQGGLLSVTGASGTTVSLATEKGKAVSFDLGKLAFV